MERKHQNEALTPQQVEALHSLGGVTAPDELWDRVSLATLEEVPAPAELWDRVALATSEPESAPDELWHRTAAAVKEVAGPQPTGRLLAFPRRLAAAAALLLVVCSGFLALDFKAPAIFDEGKPLAMAPREALHAYYRSRVTHMQVRPSQLSPTARHLASAMGATTGGRQR